MSLIKKTNGDFPSFRSLYNDVLNLERFFEDEPMLNRLRQVPSVNIREKDAAFEVEMAAPGMDKKDFKLQLENNVLSISAEKKEEKNEETETFTRREFSYNSFVRSFELPTTVNADSIEARYQDGILRLILPKKEEAKQKTKKQIAIS
jgi:HSP20 family protein